MGDAHKDNLTRCNYYHIVASFYRIFPKKISEMIINKSNEIFHSYTRNSDTLEESYIKSIHSIIKMLYPNIIVIYGSIYCLVGGKMIIK